MAYIHNAGAPRHFVVTGDVDARPANNLQHSSVAIVPRTVTG